MLVVRCFPYSKGKTFCTTRRSGPCSVGHAPFTARRICVNHQFDCAIRRYRRATGLHPVSIFNSLCSVSFIVNLC